MTDRVISGDERDAHATYELARLRTELKPFKLHWFTTVGSTNTHAAKMRRESRLLAPSVLLTSHQTAGRGRGGNVWHAPRGVVTATFVLSVHDTLPPQHVPLIAGLAVRDAVAELGATDVGLKWPNDLWHHDRKLAGLLCERLDRLDLIGVGLNANLNPKSLPPALAATTTSLQTILGMPVDQTTLVSTIAKHLRRTLDDARTSLGAVRHAWLAHDVLRGRRVRVTHEGDSPIEGVAEGIDTQGRLLVRVRRQVEAIISGTVRLVP